MPSERSRLRGFPVALMGLGFAGTRLHLPALRRLGARVVLAADPDRARLAAAGVPTSCDWRDALSCDARAVIVATPPEHHAELGLAVLTAGKDLYVEKPMASRRDDALALVSAARGQRRLLQVGFAYRFHPLWQRVRRLVISGWLTPPLAIEATFTAAGGTAGAADPLLDLAVHHVDLVSWILEASPRSTGVSGDRLVVEWPDGSRLRGRYGSGTVADAARLTAGGRTVEIDRAGGWRLRGGVPARCRLPPAALMRSRIADPAWERSFEFALSAFLHAAAGMAPAQGAGPEDGLRSVAVAESIATARMSGRTEPVEVPVSKMWVT